MKKLLFLLITISGLSIVYGQSVLRYEFLNSLNERDGHGPELTLLGNQGVFVVDTLNEISGRTKTVYRFQKNNGLQFNNIAAGNFIGKNYTIELYFMFDELDSWKRVVDWKNRKTDWGAYVYYGQLNFYNIQYSEEAPVHAGEYTYYVITRNGATNEVLIYTDADVKISFDDESGNALIDADGVLNFFFDDLMVPDEASSGAVASLNLYNYVLDSSQIRTNWQQIASTVFGTEEYITPSPQLMISPNPADDFATVDLSAFSTDKTVMVQLTDQTGRLVFRDEIANLGSSYKMNTGVFSPGIYILKVSSDKSAASSRLIIR